MSRPLMKLQQNIIRQRQNRAQKDMIQVVAPHPLFPFPFLKRQGFIFM